MKKLLILLLFSPLLSMAQARIGSTENEIRDEFSSYDFQRKISTGDHLFYLSAIVRGGVFYWYFNDNKICDLCYLVLDPEYVDPMVELCNNKYVRIDDTHWKKYNDGVILYMEMIYLNKYNSWAMKYTQTN
jgi:hypothetical protein